MTDFNIAHMNRIQQMAMNYLLIQKPRFSLYQRLFKLSQDEKIAYKIYKEYRKLK